MSDDPYGDAELAALYDLFAEDYAEDLAMYEAFAGRGDGRALELGVGTGRVALHLARAAIAVTGVDTARHMMDRLRIAVDGDSELADRVRLVDADMRAFDLGERFDFAFCAANTFQHLMTTSDQLATLGCVAAHLAAGGVFVAKLQSLSAVDWGAEDGALRLAARRTDPATGDTVMRLNARRAMAGTLRTSVTRVYDRIGADGAVRRRVIDYELKYTPPDELRLVLANAGLRLLRLYGDHDLSPFTEDSDSMIFVAGREGD